MKLEFTPAKYVKPPHVRKLDNITDVTMNLVPFFFVALLLTIFVHLLVFVMAGLTPPVYPHQICNDIDICQPAPWNGFIADMTTLWWVWIVELVGLAIVSPINSRLLDRYNSENALAESAHNRQQAGAKLAYLEEGRTEPYLVTDIWADERQYHGRVQRMIHIEFIPLQPDMEGATPEVIMLPADNVGWSRGKDANTTVCFRGRTWKDYGAVAQVMAPERLLELQNFVPPKTIEERLRGSRDQ